MLTYINCGSQLHWHWGHILNKNFRTSPFIYLGKPFENIRCQDIIFESYYTIIKYNYLDVSTFTNAKKPTRLLQINTICTTQDTINITLCVVRFIKMDVINGIYNMGCNA